MKTYAAIVILCLCAACGCDETSLPPMPDTLAYSPTGDAYLTSFGLLVIDRGHALPRALLEDTITQILMRAPDADVAKILPALDKATLYVLPGHTLQCGSDNEAIGCSYGRIMTVSTFNCYPYFDWHIDTTGTVAHEIGHLIGHDHDYAPWFENQKMEKSISEWKCAK